MDDEEMQNWDVLREPPLIPDKDLGGPGGCSFWWSESVDEALLLLLPVDWISFDWALFGNGVLVISVARCFLMILLKLNVPAFAKWRLTGKLSLTVCNSQITSCFLLASLASVKLRCFRWYSKSNITLNYYANFSGKLNRKMKMVLII